MPPRNHDDAGLARLGATDFLGPHHLMAAERLERLIRRARLAQRLTMSYDPAPVGGRSRGTNRVDDLEQSAADARLFLSRLAGQLPADCWGVLFDVCGLGKGLQMVETERRWPRRSAKLVLRIGLEQLAAHFGISAHAIGRGGSAVEAWREERLPLIADKGP